MCIALFVKERVIRLEGEKTPHLALNENLCVCDQLPRGSPDGIYYLRALIKDPSADPIKAQSGPEDACEYTFWRFELH